MGTKVRWERALVAASFGMGALVLATPARAEFCWDYVQGVSPIPIDCVQTGNPAMFCQAENPYSQQPEGLICHHDGNLSDCCTAVPSVQMPIQTIEEQHFRWHECFGSIGHTNFSSTPGPPYGGRISPPGRGMRWYAFHRQLLTDFDLVRGTADNRIEWVRWGNDADGNPQRLFHQYPSNPDTGSPSICATRPNAIWRRGTELDPAGGPPCEENSSPDPLASGCKRYPECLNVRTGVPSDRECGTGGLEYHIGTGGRLVVCEASVACRYFDDGTVEPNLVLPFVTSLEQFTDVEQITDLMDAYFHGTMHGAVAISGQNRCSLPPYQECTADGPCSYGTCVGASGNTAGACQNQYNGQPVPCYRNQDCGVCIAEGFQQQGEPSTIHRYCQDVSSPTNSVRDPEFWRLHKSLDVVVEAWQQLKPVDVVVVLDVSGSMTTTDATMATRFDRAKEAAGMFADALSLAAQTNLPQASSRMGLIVYSSSPQTPLLGGVLVDSATLTPAQIAAALQPITPSGCTGIGSALVAASQLLCGSQGCSRLPDKRRGILLLTDGVENIAPCLANSGQAGTCGSTCNGTVQQTEQIYTALGDTQICAIGFGDAAQINGDQLTLLAERQGGIYFHHAAVPATGNFSDLKQVFAKCFGLLGNDDTWVDPTGTMTFSQLGSEPVKVSACGETSANVMSGWDRPVEPGEMRLMLETPDGELVRAEQDPVKSSLESTWAITRVPLPYGGEQQGEWRAQLIRPHYSYVNGFTTDALPEDTGIALVRRQIQRLCPEGCDEVLYFEDGHLGPVSSYEEALAAETASGLIGSLVTAASASDFDFELNNQSWDLVVYAHQMSQDPEPYDETLVGLLCGFFEGPQPLAIVTDTRVGLPDALDINNCTGGVVEETPNLNYTTVVGDGSLLEGTHVLSNPGYSIFSYGLLRATSAENGGDAQVRIDASTDPRQNVATMAMPLFTGNPAFIQNWFVEVTFLGDSILQSHKPHFLARTSQTGLKPSVQILPSFVPEGGYDEVVATVTVESPTIGTSNFVIQNGLGTTTVGGEQISGRAGGLLAAAIPTVKSGPYVLNDDGVNGDEHPNNFYWTTEIPSLGHVDGMYHFVYDMKLTKNGCTSQRQLKQSVFVEVGVDPDSTPITSTTPPGGGVTIVDVTPQDPHGNPWGPGRIPPISCVPAASCTCSPGDVVDNLDGSYTITVHRPPGPPGNCAIDGFGPSLPVDNRLVANAGPDQLLQCAGNDRATGILDGTGSSNPNGPLNYAWTAPPGVPLQNANQAVATGSFPLGSNTVTLTVSAGPHSASDTALISVLDTTPPVLTPPPDVTTATCTGVNIGMATAVDACGGSVTIVNDAPSSFRAGTRIVTWRAIDRFGNVAVATQRVVVGLGDSAACCPSGTTVRLGTSNNDTLTGGSGADCMIGLGGQDTIRGLGGNDIMSGGEGNDTLEGGDGDDHLVGGGGQDILRGQNGRDTLLGFDGDDQCFGGPNDDRLYGGQGQDRVFGEDGNDSLFGEIGDDRLEGNAGNDLLNGGGLHDICIGGSGTNTFVLCETQQ